MSTRSDRSHSTRPAPKGAGRWASLALLLAIAILLPDGVDPAIASSRITAESAVAVANVDPTEAPEPEPSATPAPTDQPAPDPTETPAPDPTAERTRAPKA